MKPERTFWEKATLAHVFCEQESFPGDHYSRHWYDLSEFLGTEFHSRAANDLALAKQVADYKNAFFRAKSADGTHIDYEESILNGLRIVPNESGLRILEDDYTAMSNAGLIMAPVPPFNEVMDKCRAIEVSITGSTT